MLDDRIATQASLIHQLGSADGSSLARATLGSLRRQRSFAQAKLGDFLRRRDSKAPVRMSG